jgi:hypothetical protein
MRRLRTISRPRSGVSLRQFADRLRQIPCSWRKHRFERIDDLGLRVACLCARQSGPPDFAYRVVGMSLVTGGGSLSLTPCRMQLDRRCNYSIGRRASCWTVSMACGKVIGVLAFASCAASIMSPGQCVAPSTQALDLPPDLSLHSERRLINVDACITNRGGGATITIPNGIRLIFGRGLALIDLVDTGSGTDIVVRVRPIVRTRVLNVVRDCASGH